MTCGGLTQTETFTALYPPNILENVRIRAVNEVEDEYNVAGLNTVLAGLITPKSTPCNN